MRAVILGLLFLWSSILVAEEIVPPNCVPLVVTGDELIVPAEKQKIVLIHNLSSASLWITYAAPDVSSSWSSHLQAGHWSALVSHDRRLALSCIESIPGHEQQVSCANVVALCQWSAAHMPKISADNMWAAEDMELAPLTALISRHGFVLDTPVRAG
jgi:hypothetical protein